MLSIVVFSCDEPTKGKNGIINSGFKRMWMRAIMASLKILRGKWA
jgi:hypothetical protein